MFVCPPWQTYDAKRKASVSGDVEVRAMSADRQRFSRLVTL
ncbi:hypothetical protein [Photobacterium lutimaris]|nr:hypothetical protein [Photobacterium lutimaris]